MTPVLSAGQRPSISVILPNYNHGKWLARSIGAIAAQSVSSMEIVLVDDGSTDNSADVIADLRKRHDCIRLIQHEVNRGAYAAVQSGLAAAQGELLLFAAADDFILPGLLERAEAALQKHPDAAFFCSEVALVDRDGRSVGYRPIVAPCSTSGYVSPAEMRRKIRATDNWFQGPTVVYRRSCLAEIGYFDKELGTLCDGMATRLLGFRHGFYYDAKVLAAWMVDPASLSSQTSLSVKESFRLLDIGARWIAGRFPADIRSSYGRLFDRRFRFAMARQRLVWLGGQLDPDAMCDLLNWGRHGRALARILCRLPGAGSALLLVLMTLRMRPMSVMALMRSWWRVRVMQRKERAVLQRQLASACQLDAA
jgi:glycosyltransferase involved in cell wall biosynthesis